MICDQERFKFAQWLLERQIGWIAIADVKIGVIIAIQTAMAGGLAAALGFVPQKTEWAILFTVAAFVCAIGAFVCASQALFPRTDGPEKSMIFFGRICSEPRPDFIGKFRAATELELLEDCAAQVHRNAEIAAEKHHWVKNALIWSFLSAPPWVIAIVLLAQMQVPK
ncbi:MAG: hypothetical protein CVU31_01530 [Betaproteobacteria bacterium HGW-Betaproteobacteria-4]|jgi:hypothetical protein|nr:MAG: hypothetical protein CVU31_01530 [Betaproteobacteria bacterium HGW-Betaproteobacteria-4]